MKLILIVVLLMI